MRILCALVAAIAVGLGYGSPDPVLAQATNAIPAPADDWTLAERDDVTAAYVQFDSGIDFVVRCQDGHVESLIVGLPPTQERTRELRLSLGDAPGSATTWYAGADPAVAVSGAPARFARTLRGGGRFNIVVPGGAEGGRNLRYVLDLPTSASAVERTLSACGKPLVDPRDAEIEELPEGALPSGITWARRPQLIYPVGIRMYAWGFATIACLSQPDGRLDSCQVEAQHLLDGGFGAAALRAVRLARVEVTDRPGEPVPRRMVLFTARFETDEADSRVQPETGSRIRPD